VVRSAKVNTDDHPTLIAVGRAGAGVDNITVEEATKKGIAVFNTPGANANAVAELVFIMLGVYARCIDQAQSFLKELDWSNPVEALKKMRKTKPGSRV
jgi:D-3-phosphoglycerate dehydrogenase